MAEREWISMQHQYEGFPLYLRFPRGLNYDTLQAALPVRVAVEHTFNFRRFNGEPEPRYNETLEDFDVELSALFDGEAIGQVVLIETFGGKRTYYFYVAPSVDPEAALRGFQLRHPGNRLDIEVKNDPAWRLIRRYSADFFPDV